MLKNFLLIFILLPITQLSFGQAKCPYDEIFRDRRTLAVRAQKVDDLIYRQKKIRVQKKIEEIYEKLLIDGMYTEKNISKLVELLYARELVKKESFIKRLLTPKTLEASVRKETRKLFIRKDLETAFRDMGLWGDPSFINSFKRFRVKHKLKEQMALSLAVNTVSISTLGTPLYVPSLKLLKSKPIPKHLYDKYLRRGFEATFPDILAHYKIRGYTQGALKRANSIYGKVMTVVIGVFLYKNWDYLKFATQSYFISDKGLAEREEETFDLEEKRLQSLESWKNGYFDEMEEWPTEEEVNEEWEYLLTLEENDLKNQYSEE